MQRLRPVTRNSWSNLREGGGVGGGWERGQGEGGGRGALCRPGREMHTHGVLRDINGFSFVPSGIGFRV